jgi:hypothetical protein
MNLESPVYTAPVIPSDQFVCYESIGSGCYGEVFRLEGCGVNSLCVLLTLALFRGECRGNVVAIKKFKQKVSFFHPLLVDILLFELNNLIPILQDLSPKLIEELMREVKVWSLPYFFSSFLTILWEFRSAARIRRQMSFSSSVCVWTQATSRSSPNICRKGTWRFSFACLVRVSSLTFLFLCL